MARVSAGLGTLALLAALLAGCSSRAAASPSRSPVGQLARYAPVFITNATEVSPSVLFVAGERGVLRSDDGGRRWSVVYRPTPADRADPILASAFLNSRDAMLVFGRASLETTTAITILVTTDSGRHWSSSVRQFSHDHLCSSCAGNENGPALDSASGASIALNEEGSGLVYVWGPGGAGSWMQAFFPIKDLRPARRPSLALIGSDVGTVACTSARDCVAVFSGNGARMDVAIDYSNDGGRHFEPTKAILDGSSSPILAVPVGKSGFAVSAQLDPVQPPAGPARVWESSDGGDRFTELDPLPRQQSGIVRSLSVTSAGEIFALVSSYPIPAAGYTPSTALDLDLEPHLGAPWRTVARLDSSIFGHGGSQPSTVSFSSTRDAIATDGGDGLAITTDGGMHWATLTVRGRYRAGS